MTRSQRMVRMVGRTDVSIILDSLRSAGISAFMIQAFILLGLEKCNRQVLTSLSPQGLKVAGRIYLRATGSQRG